MPLYTQFESAPGMMNPRARLATSPLPFVSLASPPPATMRSATGNTTSSQHSFRLKRVRDHRIVMNAHNDTALLSQAMNFAKQRPTEVFYKKGSTPIMPTGPHEGEQNKIYDYEPIAIDHRSARRLATRTGPVSINEKFDEARVPVFSVLNGRKGATRAQLQEDFTVVGLAEGANRDNGDPGLSAVVGGIIPFANLTGSAIPTVCCVTRRGGCGRSSTARAAATN